MNALAEESARRYDTSVCIIIPPTHSCTVCITPLTESMLHEGLQHALRANKTLQCTLPNNVLKTGLLQRNTTKPHTLLGGTGWSVQRYWSNRNPCLRLHRPVVPIWLPSTEICPMSPILPTPPKHYHHEKQTHHSSNDTRITQFISENHSVGN